MDPFGPVMNMFDNADDKLYAFELLFLDVVNKHAALHESSLTGQSNAVVAKSDPSKKSSMESFYTN